MKGLKSWLVTRAPAAAILRLVLAVVILALLGAGLIQHEAALAVLQALGLSVL